MSNQRATGYGIGSAKIPLAPVPFPTKKILDENDYAYNLGQLAYQETDGFWVIYSGSGMWEPIGGGAAQISTINDILPDASGNFTLTAGNGISITPGSNSLTLAMSSPFTGLFTFTSSSGVIVEKLSVTNSSGTNAALVSATATAGTGSDVGYFSSGQTGSFYWNFGMIPTSEGNHFNIAYSGSQGDPSAGTVVFKAEPTGKVYVLSGDFEVSRSQAVGGAQLILSNSNVGAAANVRMIFSSAGMGDLYTLLDSPEGSAGSWEYGVKASSQDFEIQSAPLNETAGFMDGTAVFRATQLGEVLCTVGNFSVSVAGKGLRVKEGSNAKQGTGTLTNGVATISNTSVTANSRIFVSPSALNASTAVGSLRVTAQTASTSFVVTSVKADASTETGDQSSFSYEIFEPSV